MNPQTYDVTGTIWMTPGPAAWYFITIDLEISKDIKANHSLFRRGFGSIPVTATLNKTTWKTSIFLQKSGTYILPLKKAVRTAEHLSLNNTVNIALEIGE